jgi:hypothetical protein
MQRLRDLQKAWHGHLAHDFIHFFSATRDQIHGQDAHATKRKAAGICLETMPAA